MVLPHEAQSAQGKRIEPSNKPESNNNDNIYPLPDLEREEKMKRPLKDHVKIPIFHPDLNNMGVDELMTKSFADIVQQKVDSGEWGSKVGNDRQDFASLKESMRPAVFWGTLSAVSQFCFLRWYGARRINRSIKKGPLWPWSLLQRNMTNEFFESTRLKTSPWHSRIKTKKDGTHVFKEGWGTKPFTIAMDAGVSVFGGCVVGFIAADKNKLHDALSNIPLKEGYSPVSDLLCHDFLVQDAKIPSELWDEHTDDAMRSLRKFLDNCRSRTLYEHQLRRDNMIPPNEPVAVPPPGVPSNILDSMEVQDLIDQAMPVDETDPKPLRRTQSRAAWSPEDYKFFEDDSDDDWESDEGSEDGV